MKNNRIVIFGWADSVHVQRWCVGLAKRGFEIKLISVVGKTLDSVETVILPYSGNQSYLSNIKRAKKEAVIFNPDLIHAHYVAGNGLLAWKSGLAPFLGSVWGTDVIDLPRKFAFKFVLRRILRSTDHVTATSVFLKETAVKLEPSIQNKITVIPFGVEVPKDTFAMEAMSKFKLCFVKSLKRIYGLETLLNAMSLLKDLNDNIHLTIAGDGPMREELGAMIHNLNLEKNVTMIGFVENKKVYELISSHHLMVMPSISESFGVAAIEAGACARPVIASRVGGVPEVVLDRNTGILVRPGDAEELSKSIAELADNRELCYQMGQNGYEFVKENYNWEKSLDQMCELYERLIYESKKN